ncbi:MAG: O-antigen ligase [Caulobacteraceae bacterium]
MTAEAEGRNGFLGERTAFALSVFIVLTFSQGWITALGGDESAESGLIRALYFPAYFAGMALALSQPWTTIKAAARVPLVWVLLAVVAMSATWSISPDVTFRRSMAISFTTLGGLVIGARYDWRRLLEVMATAFAILAALSLVASAAIPHIGRMAADTEFPGAWRGLWFDKNGLGSHMALGAAIFTAAAILNPPRRWLWAAFAGLAIMLVLASTSKTSLVALLLGMGAVTFVALVKRGPATAVAATLAAVVGVMAIVCVIAFASDTVFAILGKDATLTGRTKLWAAIARQAELRPWTGYGYAAVWDDKSGWGPAAWIFKRAGFTAQHAHNGWYETWLGLGYIGLIAWGTLFAETWAKTIWAVYRTKGGWFALPFMLVYSITMLTESVAFIYHDFVWVIFTAVSVRLATPARVAAPVAARSYPGLVRATSA